MKKNNILLVISVILLFFVECLHFTIEYLNKYYVVNFEMVVGVLGSKLNGTASNILLTGIRYVVPRIIVVLAAYIFIIYILDFNKIKTDICIKIYNKTISFDPRVLLCLMLIFLSILAINNELIEFRVYDYISSKREITNVYEEYLVEPNDFIISSSGSENNLILIYLESMEATFAGEEDVGGSLLENNLIPNLTKLANENISFSNNNGFGGYNNFNATSWTMGGDIC